MHLAAKTTLQLTWVLPVKRLNIIRARYSTATILRTRNPFPHATLPSPSSYHSPLVSSRSSPAPRSELSPLSRDVPFALTTRVQVGRSTRPVSAKRTLSQDFRTNERHRPRGGLKDAQGACRRDRSIKRGRGCIDKQWRSVPFALTAQPKIGRNTHPVSAKGTMVDIGGRWRLSESFEAPR